MSRPGDSEKQFAYKCADEALKLDAAQREKEAFILYLQSISYTTSALYHYADQNIYPGPNNLQSKKLLNVAKRCLDRVEELSEILSTKTVSPSHISSSSSLNIPSGNHTTNVSDLSSSYNPKSFDKKFPPEFKNNDIKTNSIDTFPSMNPVILPQPFVENEKPNLLDISISSLDMMPSYSLETYLKKGITISPFEQVQKENQQLMAAYQARIARTHGAGARANLKLALQRRLAENMTLARAKQEVLYRHQKEREERLFEQATRKLKNLTNKDIKVDIQRKKLYAKVLEYEQNEKWPQSLKEKLKLNPKDFSLIDQIVKQTLSVPDHPLSKFLQSLQFKVYDRLYPLLKQNAIYLNSREKGLDSISEAKVDSLFKEVVNETVLPGCSAVDTDQLYENSDNCHKDFRMTLDAFEQALSESSENVKEAIKKGNGISTKIKEGLKANSSSFDESKNELDEDLKKELNKIIRSNSFKGSPSEEKAMDFDVMVEDALKRHIKNIVIDVRDALDNLLIMLTLTYDELNSPEGRDQCYASVEEPFFQPVWPYLFILFRLAFRSEEITIEKVMTKMKDITLETLGVSKIYWGTEDPPYQNAISEMKNIVNFCCPLKKLDTLVQVARIICQDNSSTSQGNAVGADDLIPVLCYVVIHTSLPQLVAECHAMEQFIHEGYLMGEEGYCLTSMQTVIQYLLSQA